MTTNDDGRRGLTRLVTALAPGTGASEAPTALWSTLLQACVDAVPGAEAGTVLERDADGSLRFAASVGFDQDRLEPLRIPPSALHPSHRDGAMLGSRLDVRMLTDEDLDALNDAGADRVPASTLSVAIRPGGRLIGYLQLDAWTPDAFGADALDVAVVLGELVSARLDRARLERAVSDARRDAERASSVDALTGLPNRDLLLDRLSQAIARDQRTERSTALLIADVRDLRRVNDAYGHTVADRLLRSISRQLKETVRDMDTVGHLGGGEFGLVAPAIDTIADAEALVERIETLSDLAYEIGDVTLHPRLAVGVALAPTDADDARDLLRNAELALTRAKLREDRAVAWFMHDVDDEHRERSRLAEELRGALLGGQGVWVAFQPLHQLSDGACLGIEALARWDRRSEPSQLVPPSVFGPLTDELGLTHVLSSRVYDRAFAVFASLESFRGRALWRLGLNVSASQLRDDDLAQLLRTLSDRYGVPLEEVDLEVPAPIVFEAGAAALQRLRALRELGCRVVVDDFAAHRDEIDRLEGMPIDALKIDPRWITALDDDMATRRVSSIVSAAGRLGLEVVAEGVESDAQGRRLAELGVDAVQGFAVAPPMHAAALLAWLSTRSLLR